MLLCSGFCVGVLTNCDIHLGAIIWNPSDKHSAEQVVWCRLRVQLGCKRLTGLIQHQGCKEGSQIYWNLRHLPHGFLENVVRAVHSSVWKGPEYHWPQWVNWLQLCTLADILSMNSSLGKCPRKKSDTRMRWIWTRSPSRGRWVFETSNLKRCCRHKFSQPGRNRIISLWWMSGEEKE